MKTVAVLMIVAACAAVGSSFTISNIPGIIGNLPIFHKPGTPASQSLGEALRGVIESFQKVMACGVSDLGIPPMAPFRDDEIDLDIQNDLLALTGEIDNLVVSGLENFLIIDLSTKDTRTTFDIIFPNIDILGEFDLSIFEDLAGFNFTLKPKGLLNLHLKDLRINGGITVHTNLIGGMDYRDLKFYIDLGDVESEILDTRASVAVNQFVNKYLRDATLLFAEENRENISKAISRHFLWTLDSLTLATSQNEAINVLVQASQYFDSVQCVV